MSKLHTRFGSKSWRHTKSHWQNGRNEMLSQFLPKLINMLPTISRPQAFSKNKNSRLKALPLNISKHLQCHWWASIWFPTRNSHNGVTVHREENWTSESIGSQAHKDWVQQDPALIGQILEVIRHFFQKYVNFNSTSIVLMGNYLYLCRNTFCRARFYCSSAHLRSINRRQIKFTSKYIKFSSSKYTFIGFHNNDLNFKSYRSFPKPRGDWPDHFKIFHCFAENY